MGITNTEDNKDREHIKEEANAPSWGKINTVKCQINERSKKWKKDNGAEKCSE